MKTKVLKLCSLLMALLVMTSLLAACGDSGADEPEAPVSQQEGNGADVDESTELDFWLGEYTNDSGTLTIDNSGGTFYYALGYIGENGTSAASGTLSEDSSDPYVLEESDFIFTYNESDKSIEVSLQEGAADMEHYTGRYDYVGPVGDSASSGDDSKLDVDAPDSIEAWYGEYEGDAGTLSITDSLEDLVDFTL